MITRIQCEQNNVSKLRPVHVLNNTRGAAFCGKHLIETRSLFVPVDQSFYLRYWLRIKASVLATFSLKIGDPLHKLELVGGDNGGVDALLSGLIKLHLDFDSKKLQRIHQLLDDDGTLSFMGAVEFAIDSTNFDGRNGFELVITLETEGTEDIAACNVEIL